MWLAHAQLLDSAFPIGAFAHSFGLETLVQEDIIATPDDLREYCETMLCGSWAPCDALAVKAVYQWTPIEQLDELWDFDRALHLSRAACETREGQRKLGKRMLEMARVLHPGLNWQPLVEAIANGRAVGSYPVVYGWACYHLEVPLQRVATGLLYANLSSCLNNATRAMRLGQTQSQTILTQLLPAIDEAWQAVAARDPWQFESNVPSTEIAMMRHETLYSRLFMS